MVLITVNDTGIGIPQHLQPFIFNTLTKAHRPGIRGGESTDWAYPLLRALWSCTRAKSGLKVKKIGDLFFLLNFRCPSEFIP
jgi:two-component system sensor histidine kinase VicK